ncbi:hypothetical protein CLOM_g3051 [Closterium sp. NIES-68]|nr:hypothetical protein CLOM_g3051 [Closterium sp. NIES-68]GJP79914.1 hypothetical protein CLOP_g10129 [Closterium sp. NIES-67]
MAPVALGAVATPAALVSRVSNRPARAPCSPARGIAYTCKASAAETATSSSATSDASAAVQPVLLTCRQCKQPFDPALNHPSACSFHPAHYGGEVKRKWKSNLYHKVGTEFLYHSEETRAEWGEVENFWDCCGRNDPMDPGCTKGPHRSYDDA